MIGHPVYRLRTFLLVTGPAPQMMDEASVGNVVHYEPSNVLILTGISTINKLIKVIKRVGCHRQQRSSE